jgi:hypothetical protein
VAVAVVPIATNEVESAGVSCAHHDKKMDGLLLNHGSLDECCASDDGRGRL